MRLAAGRLSMSFPDFSGLINSGGSSHSVGLRSMRLSRDPESPIRVCISLLGANGVGKSAFAVRLMTQRFIGEYSDKLDGVYNKQDSVGGYYFEMNMKDTVDKEHINLASICRWSHIAVVIYSIDDRSTYQRALGILEQLSRHDQAREVTLALVGNKADLDDKRRVTALEALAAAREEDSQFAELSVAEEPQEPSRLMRRLLGQHAANCQAHQRERQLLLLGPGDGNCGGDGGRGSRSAGSRSRGSSPCGPDGLGTYGVASSAVVSSGKRQQKKSMEVVILRSSETPASTAAAATAPPAKKNSTPFKALKERFTWK